MRRRSFRAAAGSAAVAIASTAILLAGPSTSAAPEIADGLSRPILRLDGAQTAGVNMLPAHAPVPAGSSGIGPGAQLLIDRPGGSFICTANFIWTNTTTTQPTKPNGKPDKKKPPTVTKKLYLGTAGHCLLPTGLTSTHGPDADFDPALVEVSVCVSTCDFGGQLGPIFEDFLPLGPVAYARQTKRGVGLSNDFGIVEIPSSVSPDLIRPSIPVWEGPSNVEDVTAGGNVCLYGNGTATGETFVTKARTGVGEGVSEDRRYWKTFMPSSPGDSGSALVTCGPDADGMHGRGAAGILTHIGLLQHTARVVGTTTSRAVEMAQEDASIALRLMLEDGTEVDPPPLPPLPPSPPPVTPDEEVHPVAVGGSHAWEAGPFNRQAPPEAIFFGEACSGTEPPSEHCDYEFVDLDVPAAGADLTVTVSTADAEGDDFDLFVYGPDGEEVGEPAAAAGTPPEVVSVKITRSGVYTIAVDPYGVTDANYAGKVELTDPAPPPVPDHDGEVSVGTTYSWTGDPPLDANLFTCAGLGEAFCDNELIKVDVPSGGATLVVDISAVNAGDDFDVCVYTPSGAQTCSAAVGDEHLELPVTVAGVYRVGVAAFLAPLGTYSGVAALG